MYSINFIVRLDLFIDLTYLLFHISDYKLFSFYVVNYNPLMNNKVLRLQILTYLKAVMDHSHTVIHSTYKA